MSFEVTRSSPEFWVMVVLSRFMKIYGIHVWVWIVFIFKLGNIFFHLRKTWIDFAIIFYHANSRF
jgi:hypothetical protein